MSHTYTSVDACQCHKALRTVSSVPPFTYFQDWTQALVHRVAIYLPLLALRLDFVLSMATVASRPSK
eukprot:m.357745 g.357745  ORF g.357745 m.357745 type:complete len:67 (+) comp17923_c0_seq1:1193-1393(+)